MYIMPEKNVSTEKKTLICEDVKSLYPRFCELI